MAGAAKEMEEKVRDDKKSEYIKNAPICHHNLAQVIQLFIDHGLMATPGPTIRQVKQNRELIIRKSNQGLIKDAFKK